MVYMFHQMVSDTAREQSMRFESPEIGEKVYFGTIVKMYQNIISPAITVIRIQSPVVSHKGLYKAIKERYTFRPILLPNKMVSFYAWLPHVSGATIISMPSCAFYTIIILVSNNPDFKELGNIFTFHELTNLDETNLVEYPKALVPQIDSGYGSNIFSEIFSTTIMILNFMAVISSTPKAFYDNFQSYFMNSRIEFVTIPKDLEFTVKPFNLIPDADSPIGFKQNDDGVCDAVMMHPDAVKILYTMVISHEGNTVALLHFTPKSRVHPKAVQLFNENAYKLIGKYLSVHFKLKMQLLSEFRKSPS